MVAPTIPPQCTRKAVSAQGGGPVAELLAAGAPSANEWRRKVDALPDNVANPAVKKARGKLTALLF